MGRDIERIMRDQAAREAARSDTKAVWRALALAGGGTSPPHRPAATQTTACQSCHVSSRQYIGCVVFVHLLEVWQ
jgi:hypothetical protein